MKILVVIATLLKASDINANNVMIMIFANNVKKQLTISTHLQKLKNLFKICSHQPKISIKI